MKLLRQRSDRICAVTSPRGGLVTLWSVTDEAYLGSVSLPDCCGIAATGSAGEFLLTNGAGQVVKIHPDSGSWSQTLVESNTEWHWDNHLTPG